MYTKSDDHRIARLIDTGTEIDPNLIAAYVDGGLSPAERLSLERRMAADPEAQLLLRTMRERRNPAAVWLPIAAMAAAVLVGFLMWSKRGDEPALTLEERLGSVVASLRTDATEPFGEFALLSDDELTSGPSTRRGAVAWLHPRGLLLEAPSELRWTNPEDGAEMRVSLRGPGMKWTRDVEGSSVDVPALTPGRYVATLQSLDSLAGQKLRRTFVVADETERAELERAIALIRSKADDDIQDLVIAHFALRTRLYDVARAAATRATQGVGDVKSAAQRLVEHIEVIQGR